jgi:hypothetical protein
VHASLYPCYYRQEIDHLWANNRKDELVDLLSNEVGVIIYMEWILELRRCWLTSPVCASGGNSFMRKMGTGSRHERGGDVIYNWMGGCKRSTVPMQLSSGD